MNNDCIMCPIFLVKYVPSSLAKAVNSPESVERPLLKGMWTIHPDGRLGNQMGQYATLYALAKQNGYQAYMLPEMKNYLAPLFKVSMPVLSNDKISATPWTQYDLHDWMSEEYNHIQRDHIKLKGFPCSWTFFHHIRDEILKEFTFHDSYKIQAISYLQDITKGKKNVTFVGVHVRRGDYVNVMPQHWRGVIGDKAYFEKAMDYFRKKYRNVVFVVTSNGMDWCRENLDNSRGDLFFIGDGNESSPGRDLSILVHCNHTIMSIGTFGFWASYLTGGEAIYLTNFTLQESNFLKIFKYDAAFLPEWHGIAADLSPLL
ncbi:galactoside alpha-(1,2)-fucosyltransferase 2-like isoform X2 [Protopterus annectens]|nr:galactoside alpha-(1,2)-fucosyltransferase 2-like isoform X2 [Protopterus annectens]